MKIYYRIVGALVILIMAVIIYYLWPFENRLETFSFYGEQSHLKDSGADNIPTKANRMKYSPVDSDNSIIELSASMFTPSPSEACERLSETIHFIQISDGRVLSKEELPLAVQEAVARLCVVVPNLDCNETDLKSLLRFFYVLQNETNPQRPQSDGLVNKKMPPDDSLIKKDKEAGIFFNQLPFNNVLNCSLRRIILLELYEQLSHIVNINIGLFPDGQYVIGYDGNWASSNTPAYLLVFPRKGSRNEKGS